MDDTTLAAGVEATGVEGAEAPEAAGGPNRAGDGMQGPDSAATDGRVSAQIQPTTLLPGHLRQLESEAIFVLREVAAQF